MSTDLAFTPGETSLNYSLWDERGKKLLIHNVFIKPLNYVQATECITGLRTNKFLTIKTE